MIQYSQKELRLNQDGTLTCVLTKNLPAFASESGELDAAIREVQHQIYLLGDYKEVSYDKENKFIALNAGDKKIKINFSGINFGALSSRLIVTINHSLKDLELPVTADRAQQLYQALGVFTNNDEIDWSKLPRDKLTWDFDDKNVATKNFTSRPEARCQLLAAALLIFQKVENVKVSANLLVPETVELKVTRGDQSLLIKNKIEKEGEFEKLELYVSPDSSTYMGQATSDEGRDVPFINEIQHIIGLDFVREHLEQEVYEPNNT